MQELEYLRNELNQRIILSNENHNKVIGNILMVWGGTLVLFAAMHKDISGVNKDLTVFWYFVIITIFFISALVLYFFSCRLYDNSNQVFRSAAYNTVFYEKRPSISDKKGEIRAWEIATFEMAKKEMKDPNERRYYKTNNEYVIFTLFTTIMEILLLVMLFVKTNNMKDVLDNVMLGMCVAYIIVSLVLLYWIYNKLVLSPEKWHDRKKYHLRFFIGYAEETGYYTRDELVGRFGKIFLDDIGYTSITVDTVVS